MENNEIVKIVEKSEVELDTKSENKLIRLYFLWYMILGPFILVFCTLIIDANTKTIPPILESLFYLVIILFAIKVAFPIIKPSLIKFKELGLKAWKIIASHVFITLAFNIGVGLIISFLTNTTTSANEIELDNSARQSPFLYIFLTLIFAPIFEELVFRSAIFSKIRKTQKFVTAALWSGFCFGSIHVVMSLISGDFIDLPYVLVYMSIGFVLARSYEKSGTVVVPIIVHFINNLIASIPLLF